ncbi:hypothetical protein AMS68_007724 [Peltaster fructicola]|uniref:FAD/NAD(P)-binding domain-containing protein n=1 Tax=Peltaster fructicola TaxID=286661 RepID=A0A6H0Y586_9PEZI|nr:hypothetical protein AMS68_007724 [Peltaster fructicola]
MAETRNIVVLGASCSGLSAAHYIAKHTLPKLQAVKNVQYALHIVDPSTHFWWHIGAPREIVSVKQMPHEKYFIPIKDGFKQYTSLQSAIHFHQASATGLDTTARTVTLTAAGAGEPQVIPYYALVIATGVTSPTPLTTLHGEHTKSIAALDAMNTKLASAKEVLISGGGPVAVETAGEIAYHLKNVHTTLVTSGDKLTPVFKKSRAEKVQKMLEKAGVTVVYNAKVESSNEGADGKTTVTLSGGKTHVVDVYIPAHGVVPNTDFVSASLKNEKGYIKTNVATLRVDGAGARVYAIGDVSGVDHGGVLKMYSTIPIWGANFNHDILGEAKVATVSEKTYSPKDDETQFVPVGPKGGVAAFNGWGMPSFMVALAKGKDYLAGSIPEFTQGTKWVKA